MNKYQQRRQQQQRKLQARKRQQRKLVRRQPQRRNITTRRNQSNTLLPSLRSQLSNAFRTTFRVVWDVGTGADSKWTPSDSYSAIINTGYIFVTPMNKYQKIFQSFKVHKITARWMQAVTASDRVGFNVLSLVHPEFSNSSTNLNVLVGSNASVVRPDGQVALVKYAPLEPTEFDWMFTKTDHTYAKFLMKTFPDSITSWFSQSTNKNSIWGKIIVDIDITMNGLGDGIQSPSQCECSTCSDPSIILASAIQHAYNEKHGGTNILPYLIESAAAGITPEEYITAHDSDDPVDWTKLLSKALDLPSVQVEALTLLAKSKIPLYKRRTRFDQVPTYEPTSPVISEFDMAE